MLRPYVVYAAVVSVMLATLSSARPSPNEVEEMKQALIATCNAKHPISDEIKTKVMTGVLSEERELKCYLKCTFEEISLIDEDGNIDGETLLATIPLPEMKSIIEQVLQTCLPGLAGKPDNCEVTYNFIKCGLNVNKNIVKILPF